jgi:hypothetical protein
MVLRQHSFWCARLHVCGINRVSTEGLSPAAQGWTTPYDFSVADLRAAADVVAAAAAGGDANAPDWQQLLGLLQVIYGGRVSSKQDAKVNRGSIAAD